MNLVRYVGRRAALTIFVIFGVSLITFVISHVVPADPVVAYLGEHAPPDLVEKVRHQIGLDRPLPVQYVLYLYDLFHGNLGTSIMNNRPVSRDLAQYLPEDATRAPAP